MTNSKRLIKVGNYKVVPVQEPTVVAPSICFDEALRNYATYNLAISNKHTACMLMHGDFSFVITLDDYLVDTDRVKIYRAKQMTKEFLPHGCRALYYIAMPQYRPPPSDNENLVWSATYGSRDRHPRGRALVDAFYSCLALMPTDGALLTVFDRTVSFAARDVHKCRFDVSEYFEPRPQFFYLGFPYA